MSYLFERKGVFIGVILLGIVALLFFVFSGPNDDIQEIEIAIEKSNTDSHVEKVVYIERIDDDVILAIYDTPSGLAVGRLKDSLFGWKWVTGTGYLEFNSGRDLSWIWSDLGNTKEPLPVYYGFISSPHIDRVEIGRKYQAKKVATYRGKSIWFLIGQSTSGTEEIQGLTAEGEVLYSRLGNSKVL